MMTRSTNRETADIWEGKGYPQTVALVYDILEGVREIEPDTARKYNKYYIGIARGGTASNFVTFRPRGQHLLVELEIPRSAEITQQIEDTGINLLTYQTRHGQYRLSMRREDVRS